MDDGTATIDTEFSGNMTAMIKAGDIIFIRHATRYHENLVLLGLQRADGDPNGPLVPPSDQEGFWDRLR